MASQGEVPCRLPSTFTHLFQAAVPAFFFLSAFPAPIVIKFSVGVGIQPAAACCRGLRRLCLQATEFNFSAR